MIDRLVITDPDDTPVKWWKDVAFCAAQSEWQFSPGLTIVWGPNGSGKSTLLLLLARLLHCEQGGISMVTETSAGMHLRNLKSKVGATVYGDGTGARYVLPAAKIGLIGGTFDDDFFMEGVLGIFSKVSGGQQTIRRILNLKTPAPPVQSKLGLLGGLPHAASLLPRIPGGPPTVLLDEPDLHLSIPNQRDLWHTVIPQLVAAPTQAIVATHSPWAVYCAATYLETKPGYLDKCREVLKELPR